MRADDQGRQREEDRQVKFRTLTGSCHYPRFTR